jgi:uncharacterized protein
MTAFQLFSDYTLFILLSLGILAFVAGFIDAVVGGGGLIQLPALLINFPKTPLPTLFGTNKIAALAGTSIAAYQYAKRIKYDYPLLIIASLSSAIFSYAGAKVVSYINVNTLKPIILVILILMAIYTFTKKDLGSVQTKTLSQLNKLLLGSLIGMVVGFYDGFFGPGTGSFLVLGFVIILGFPFIEASAYSKVINCMTNISALVVFVKQGNYLIELAIVMAICNIIGNVVGTKMAFAKGNQFVRLIFSLIVVLMIVRYSYDIFIANPIFFK